MRNVKARSAREIAAIVAAALLLFFSPGRSSAVNGDAGPPAAAGDEAAHPSGPAVETQEPAWADGDEELVFRISYLGVTAGYARFAYRGKVAIDGKDTYHIHVRAWTSSLLGIVYPLNDSLDYYLDVRTLLPVRQDFTQRERNKENDDISTYDQETGTITTREKFTGKLVKTVTVAPNIHDPVTVVYEFRARNRWGDGHVSRLYAGRKLWEISATKVGVERIAMGGGEIESILVRPVIKRDGKVENKGDLRLWMTNDARHVPLRIYAKIKLGTLVGELVQKEGGVSDARQ